jgi:hypothetical protein
MEYQRWGKHNPASGPNLQKKRIKERGREKREWEMSD